MKIQLRFQTMKICVHFQTEIHLSKQSVVEYLAFLYEHGAQGDY